MCGKKQNRNKRKQKVLYVFIKCSKVLVQILIRNFVSLSKMQIVTLQFILQLFDGVSKNASYLKKTKKQLIT